MDFRNRILLYWDANVTFPLEAANNLFFIFKVTQTYNRIRFYWQWLNASQAELYPLQPSSNYRVKVGFGLIQYATLSLCPAIRSHYSNVITTSNRIPTPAHILLIRALPLVYAIFLILCSFETRLPQFPDFY